MRTGERPPGAGGNKLAALFEYWVSKADGRRLPGRRDIDPIDLRRQLSSLMLVDGIGEGGARRSRFRLVGTALARLMVRDPTARPLGEVLDEPELEALDGVFNHIAEQGMPAAVYGRLIWDNGWGVPVEWLFLPLAADGVSVDMILAYADLPPLPIRLPPGRPRLEFSWRHPIRPGAWAAEPAAAPANRGWLPQPSRGVLALAAS